MEKDSKIYIAGHNGLVGSAIMRQLKNKGYSNIITKELNELNLINQTATAEFFQKEKPDYVILAAAKVGGIVANNTYRGDFIYQNLQIQNNVIHFSYVYNVKKLLFLGSSCIYPKNAPQPLKEEYLLTSELEYTNEPYAIAKIAGLKMVESYNLQYNTNFISVMPTNLYGKNDNYDLEKSHVLPALIRKMHLGKCLDENNWDAIKSDLKKMPIEEVCEKDIQEDILKILSKYGINKNENRTTITLWGTGEPYREFLFSDDMADACIYLLENVDATEIKNLNHSSNFHLNIGTGKDLTIRELSEKVKQTINFNGEIHWDTEKPDGTYRKLQDVSKLNQLGWKEKISLDKGIELVYEHYLKN